MQVDAFFNNLLKYIFKMTVFNIIIIKWNIIIILIIIYNNISTSNTSKLSYGCLQFFYTKQWDFYFIPSFHLVIIKSIKFKIKGLGFNILGWALNCIVQTHVITYPPQLQKKKNQALHNACWTSSLVIWYFYFESYFNLS
jgi:hypothetical protein